MPRRRDRTGGPPWRRYLRFWSSDVAGDVSDELRFHIEMRVGEYVAAGMSPADARAEALRRFGNVEYVAQTCRTIGEEWETEMRRSEWIEAFRQDVVYGFRQLRRSPVVALVAIVTLALGIGANTAIFSVVSSVLLRPLPFADPERIVHVSETYRGQDGGVSIGSFHEWRTHSRSFDDLAAYVSVGFNFADGSGEPERVFGARVSPAYFRVAHIPPVLGRYFQLDEEQPGRAHVVVLSHRFWQRRFAGDRAVLGRDIIINNEPYAIIGVAPPEVTFAPLDDDLWIPFVLPTALTEQHYDEHFLTVLGALKPGVTREHAEAEVKQIAAGLALRFPDFLRERSIRIAILRDDLVRSYRTQLLVLLGAVGFVLLIACGNVANLLLARATTRQKEIAIRTALGAGRGRIIRQLLTESLVLAGAGGVVGLIVANFGIGFLVSMSPEGVPRLDQASLSPDVLAFSIVLSVASGIVFGLAPALRAAKPDLQGTLKEGGKGSAMGTSRDRLRNVLVVAEVATALVLLVGAGLLIRSSIALQRVDPGFDSSNLLSMRTALLQSSYPEPERLIQTFRAIRDAVSRVPGVESATIASQTPLAGGTHNGLWPEGRTADASLIDGTLRIVTPEYHQVMRIPLKRGRAFTDRDDATVPKVMIINETLAKLAFPGQDPIGKRISCCEGGPQRPDWKEVVGVVGDVRAWGLGEEVQAEFYLPITQTPPAAWNWIQRAMAIIVRSSTADAASLTPGIRRAVSAVDPTLPLYRVQTLDEAIDTSTAGTRFNMLLLTMLGVTGLVLAAVGIYGVIAYFVSQRTHEIGVRLALGATAGQVLALVVRQGAVLAIAGVAAGLGLAALATRVLATLLYGVSARDPLTYIGVGALLTLVALVASYLPARRATRVDPIVSLRSS